MIFVKQYSAFPSFFLLVGGSSYTFGIDWDGPAPSSGDSVVSVNPPINHLDRETKRELIEHINPLSPCPDFGIQLYINCVNFMQSEM